MNGWVGSCEITKNLINLDLIKRNSILFEDFDLWRHPYLWVGIWMVG